MDSPAATSIVYFPKPEVIIYRFLNVLKSRNQLVHQMVRHVEANINQFLRTYWNEPELVELIESLRIESIYTNNEDTDSPPVFADTQPVTAIQDSVVLYVLWKCYKASNCIDIGCKTIALRKLIHWVLLDGIIDSRFQLDIDPNQAEMIRYAHRNQIKQFVYSGCCGRLFDDKRLLSYTNQGDLTRYLQFLDGVPVRSRTKETYVQLAERFDVAPSSILLVAFSKTECKKAARAGCMVAKIREYNEPKPKYYTIRIIENIGVIRFAGSVCCPPTPPPPPTSSVSCRTKSSVTSASSGKSSVSSIRSAPPAITTRRTFSKSKSSKRKKSRSSRQK